MHGADVGRPETAAVGGNRQAGSVEPRCGWEVSQARSRFMVMAGSLIEVYSSPLKRGFAHCGSLIGNTKVNQDFEGERQENNRIFHLEKTFSYISSLGWVRLLQ
jgi:hypothetical protein